MFEAIVIKAVKKQAHYEHAGCAEVWLIINPLYNTHSQTGKPSNKCIYIYTSRTLPAFHYATAMLENYPVILYRNSLSAWQIQA